MKGSILDARLGNRGTQMDLSYGSVTNVTFSYLVWRFTSAVA